MNILNLSSALLLLCIMGEVLITSGHHPPKGQTIDKTKHARHCRKRHHCPFLSHRPHQVCLELGGQKPRGFSIDCSRFMECMRIDYKFCNHGRCNKNSCKLPDSQSSTDPKPGPTKKPSTSTTSSPPKTSREPKTSPEPSTSPEPTPEPMSTTSEPATTEFPQPTLDPSTKVSTSVPPQPSEETGTKIPATNSPTTKKQRKYGIQPKNRHQQQRQHNNQQHRRDQSGHENPHSRDGRRV